MSSIMIIDIPTFKINFKKDTNYSYKSTKLNDLLYEASDGYCMYCLSKMVVDGKRFGHAEHAIERFHSKEKLTNCMPNIGIACPTCNTSFKSRGEKDISFSQDLIDEFNAFSCVQGLCRKECSSYIKLKKFYSKKRNIILQSSGINVNKREYKIQYNILELKFEPSNDVNYIKKDIDFIQKHIERFNLNDGKYRTKELVRFCEEYVNGNVSLAKKRFDNYIVDLFIDKLLKLDDSKKAYTLCGIIVVISKLKGLT